MPSYPIACIRAISAFYVDKLKQARIRTTAALLERARTPKARKQLADASEIPLEYILRWANLADLMRVHGIAADYAELLAAAGADTLGELRRRSAAKLAARMAEANARRPVVMQLPSEQRIAGWIEDARSLEPMIRH
jgi:hypothetical protein